MLLEILDDQGRPVVLRATRVVARDHITRTPLALIIEQGLGSYTAATADDADFQRLLRAFRINDTVLVTHLDKAQSTPKIEL